MEPSTAMTEAPSAINFGIDASPMTGTNPILDEETNVQNMNRANIEQPIVVYKKKFRCRVTIAEMITLLGWIAAISFCIWYVYNSGINYSDAQINPTTSLAYVESVPLSFPAITICNWNGIYDCDTCNLTLMYVTGVNAEDGTVGIVEIPYEYVDIEQGGQYFRCVVFNNDSSNPLSANLTGYGGSYSTFFRVPLMEDDRDNRFGLQVSFHEIGTIPPVFAETNFATSGVDNFYTLTKYVTTRLRATKEYPDTIDYRWVSGL